MNHGTIQPQLHHQMIKHKAGYLINVKKQKAKTKQNKKLLLYKKVNSNQKTKRVKFKLAINI